MCETKKNYTQPLCSIIFMHTDSFICISGQIQDITEEVDDSEWDVLY